ncbi:hypothetical protein ACFLT4_00005, partial [Chloroflexota bacterium]
IYLVVQFIIDHVRRKPTDYLCFVGVIFFFVALMIPLSLLLDSLSSASLIVALVIPLLLSGISRFMVWKGVKPGYYPLALVGLGVVGVVALRIINPVLFGSMDAFSVFAPGGASRTTIEMQPILWPAGKFTLAIVWGNFSTSFFLGLISLCILVYLTIKQGNTEKSLLVVWSLVILAATIGQRRFAYYFAVNAALLTGYISWQALRLAGFKESVTKVAKMAKDLRIKTVSLKKGSHDAILRRVIMSLYLVIIFFVVFFWNIEPAVVTAEQARFAPSDAWVSSLTWMKENTPEPFGNPDAYYQLYQPPPPGKSYKHPETAYGVMAWWDYGYWITRIAHRIPNANPSQDPQPLTNVAKCFTSQDEESATEIVKEFGASYIILDHETVTGKFWAVTVWSGKGQSEFFGIYFLPQENGLVPVQLHYPAYYRSFSSRLYNFDGQAVTPENAFVVSYKEEVGGDGVLRRIITNAQQFTNYEEAESYLLSQGEGNHKIVGVDPLSSPVPLEPLEHYKLIYSSNDMVTISNTGPVPAAKVFEYME